MGDMLKHFMSGVREHDPTPIVRAAIRVAAAALMALFAMLLYAPALGDTQFVYGTDTVSHDYVMHLYGWSKSIGERGELPLWNPYMFSGMPMIGSAALCPFYPSQWLYALLPFNIGFTLQYVFAIMVGGIGAAWWMRCLGHRRSICVWAGFLYMVSGHFLTLTHAGHLQKMIALAWTPVALGATLQLVQLGRGGVRHSRRYKAAALLGIALAMQMLASHPQIFYATAAACVLQLVGMALTTMRWKSMYGREAAVRPVSPGKLIRPVGRALAMSLLALVVCAVISAVQFFPSWEMAGLSNRADGVTFAEAVETSYPPLELLEYGIPQVFGDSVRGSVVPYFGAWGERIVSDYIGLPVLFLAFVGLFGSKRRYRWFLLILLLAGVLIGLGRHTPIYWLLYESLPGFDGFRSPGTYMFLTNCALIGLAAFGLDYLISLADTVNYKAWNSSFSETDGAPPGQPPLPSDAATTQPFLIDSVPYNGTDTPPQNVSIDYDDMEDDPNYAYEYATEAPGSVSSSNFTWDNENIPWLGRPIVLIFLAAMAVTALVGTIIALAENWDVNLRIATEEELLSFHTYSRVAIAAIGVTCVLGAVLLLRLRTWVGGVLLGLIALAFPLYHNYHFLKFEPLGPYMAHLTQQPDLRHLAKTAAQPVRLLEENALKNEAMLYSISSLAGYHPVMPGDYSAMAGGLGLGSDAFSNLFAVNHARGVSDQPPEEGQWVAEPGAPTTGGGSLWRRAQAVPYVRDAADVVLVDTDDLTLTSATLRALSDARQQQAATGAPSIPYIARMSEFDARRFRIEQDPQLAEATLQQWLPHEVRMRTRASGLEGRGGALLPLSDPYFPGWRAETSEGQRLPVVPVNGAQRGVVVPQGEHRIRLVYSPYSYRLGLFVSLVSATLLVSFGIGTLARRMMKGRKQVRKVIKRAQTGRHDFPGTTQEVVEK